MGGRRGKLCPHPEEQLPHEKAIQTGWRAVWGYLVLIFEHSRRGARAWGARSSGLPASNVTQTAGKRRREPHSPTGGVGLRGWP